MQRSVMAIVTLIRNKLNNQKMDWTQKVEYFHKQGISLSLFDEDMYYLKREQKPSDSGTFKMIDTLIFRGAEVVCYTGAPIKSATVSAIDDGNFIWNQKTIYISKLEGKKVYLYFDIKTQEWKCADEKKPVSSQNSLILSQIYNIQALDPRYAYELILVDRGDDTGLFLQGMYDVKKCFELEWQATDAVALRHQFKRPPIYQFEGLDKLEASDLPIIAQDQTTSKVLLTSL